MHYAPARYWEGLHRSHRGQLSAVGYTELGEGFNREAYKLRLGALERLLQRLACRPERLIEAGVGVGAYAPLWQGLGVTDWCGLDISPAVTEANRSHFPAGRFHCLDITSDDPQDWAPVGPAGGFDLVTAIDVLYHIIDDTAFRQAVTNLASRVRPGGLLIVSDVFVPAARSIAAHVRRRPVQDYLDACRTLSCSVVDREMIFSILGDPVRRAGFNLKDEAFFAVWRVLQKTLRVLPERLRSGVGAAAATALGPLDALLRPFSQGINLELVALRRAR